MSKFDLSIAFIAASYCARVRYKFGIVYVDGV